MSNAVLTRMPDAAELAAMDMQHVAQLLRSQAAQIEWFKRQIFGQKSERYAPQPDAQPLHLGEMMPVVAWQTWPNVQLIFARFLTNPPGQGSARSSRTGTAGAAAEAERTRAAGNIRRKVEPRPSSLWMSSSPPCLCATCLTIDRPSPVPPVSRERLPSTR